VANTIRTIVSVSVAIALSVIPCFTAEQGASTAGVGRPVFFFFLIFQRCHGLHGRSGSLFGRRTWPCLTGPWRAIGLKQNLKHLFEIFLSLRSSVKGPRATRLVEFVRRDKMVSIVVEELQEGLESGLNTDYCLQTNVMKYLSWHLTFSK